MKKKLSKALQAAIQTYITNCENQLTIKWDKPADQKKIEEVAFADKFVRVEQAPGAWWFSVRRGKSMWTFYAHEDNFKTAIAGERQTTTSNVLTKLFG